MLNHKNNPQDLMLSLDEFLTMFWGDYKVEVLPGSEIAISNKLPLPLQYLYSFVEKYPSPRNGRFFNTQDGLYINNTGKKCEGKILIVGENQGVWHCGTELVEDKVDPPVWVLENEDDASWELVYDSLSQFLVTFILQESILGSKYLYNFDLEKLCNSDLEIVTLWYGTYAWNTFSKKYTNNREERIEKFYLIEDSILCWSGWCGTNYNNASKLLDISGLRRLY